MLGLSKRPLQPLDPQEYNQRLKFAAFGAAPHWEPRDVTYRHDFISENGQKRSYDEFKHGEEAQQQLAAQLNQPRTYPTGETRTWNRNPADPDTSMTDAPPVRHVHYTPPATWKPSTTTTDSAGHTNKEALPSILKRRIDAYDNLPDHTAPNHEQFEYDLSAYIEETDRQDEAFAQQQRRAKEHQEATRLQAARSLSRSYQSSLGQADFGIGTPPKPSSSRSRLSTSQPLQSRLAPELHQSRLTSALTEKRPTPPLRKILTPVPRKQSPIQRPSAVELYPALAAAPLPHNQPAAEESTPPRRFGGMIVTVIQQISGIFGWAYSRFFGSKKEEIYAVETNKTGRKRRAVAAGDIDIERNTPSPHDTVMTDSSFDDAPTSAGNVEDDQSKKQAGKQEVQAPISCPASSGSNQNIIWNDTTMNKKSLSNSEVEQQQQNAQQEAQSTAAQGTSSSDAPLDASLDPFSVDNMYPRREKSDRVTWNSQAGSLKSSAWTASRNRTSLWMTPEEEALHNQIERIKALKLQGSQAAQESRVPKVSRLPADARRPIDRSKVNQQRDQGVEKLLAKTERITLQSREFGKSLRESKIRKERVTYEEQVDELAKEEPNYKERARLEVEKETIELRKKAEQEAKEQAAREAAEAAQAAAEHAEKQKLIRALPEKWVVELETKLHSLPAGSRKVLAKAVDGVELNAFDLRRIAPSEQQVGRGTSTWLNDEGVNAVMNAIVAAKNEQNGYDKKKATRAPEIVAYSSAWYTTYKGNNKNDIYKLKSWSRRSGLQGKVLTAKKIFFPVSTGSHWLLMVIRPTERKIEVLDSFESGHQQWNASQPMPGASPLFRIAHEWLEMELGKDYIQNEWTHIAGRSQQQLNGNDCGVFTCMNALAAAKDRDPSEVTPSNGMMNARNMIVAVLLNGGFKGDWEL